MRRSCLTLMFLVSLASLSRAGDLDPMTFPTAPGPDSHGMVWFAMPSGNVDCAFTPASFNGQPNMDGDDSGKASLECERFEPKHIVIHMGETSKPTVEVADWDGDHDSGKDPVFAYGHSWKGGPFDCDSRADGLLCTRADGHGFHVSKAKADLF